MGLDLRLGPFEVGYIGDRGHEVDWIPGIVRDQTPGVHDVELCFVPTLSDPLGNVPAGVKEHLESIPGALFILPELSDRPPEDLGLGGVAPHGEERLVGVGQVAVEIGDRERIERGCYGHVTDPEVLFGQFPFGLIDPGAHQVEGFA